MILRRFGGLLAALSAAGLWATAAQAQAPSEAIRPDVKAEMKTEAKPDGKPGDPTKPKFPPFEEVTKGFEKVVTTTDSLPPLYTLWVDKKDGRVLAELPPDYLAKKYFVALTVSSGELYAGLQAGDLYVYWKRYGDALALLQKDVDTRSTGDMNRSRPSSGCSPTGSWPTPAS